LDPGALRCEKTKFSQKKAAKSKRDSKIGKKASKGVTTNNPQKRSPERVRDLGGDGLKKKRGKMEREP